MSPAPAWLFTADFDVQEVVRSWNNFLSGTREGTLIFVALSVVTLVVFVWAAFFRKPSRRRRHSHPHRHSAPPAAAGPEPARHEGMFSRSRRRRRRRREAPRNPTLAESGGLPPLRGDDPPSPSP